MRIWRYACLAALVAQSLAASAAKAGELAGWRSDLVAALKQAESESRFIVLYFTDDSAECQRLEADTLNFLPVREAFKDFVRVRLSLAENDRLAAAYRIQTAPALIFFDAQGRELDRSPGYQEWDTLLRRTAEAISPKTNYVLLRERLKSDPGDVDALYYMGYKYTRRNDYDRAAKYFERVRDLDPTNGHGFSDNIVLREIEELQRQGRFDEALKALDQFAQAHPGSDETDVAAILRARLLLQTEQLEASLAAYDQFLSEFPDSLWAPQARASVEALRAAFAAPVHIGQTATNTPTSGTAD